MPIVIRLCVDLGHEVEEATATGDAKLFTTSFVTPAVGKMRIKDRRNCSPNEEEARARA